MIEFMLVATLVGSSILAIVILMSDGKRRSNQLFAGVAACFALWSLSILLFSATMESRYALAYSKLFYGGSVLFAPLIAIFALYYPREKSIPKPLWHATVWSAVLFLAVILTQDHVIISELSREAGGWRAVVNQPGYLAFSLYFIVYFAIAIGVAFRKYFLYRGSEQKRASYYAFGILFTSIPGFVADLILPYFGDYRYIWIGPVASVLFLMMTGYSIGRHRMLDVKLFLAKTALYVIVILAISGVYAATIYVLTTVLLGNNVSPSVQFSANVVASLIVAVSFGPIRAGVDRFLNRYFRYQRYDSRVLIDEITTMCVEITDLRILVESVIDKTDDAFNPRMIAVLFRDSAHADIVRGKLADRYRSFDYLEKLVSREVIIPPTIGKVLELRTPAQRIGYFIIGSEADGRLYRHDDERAMGVIADELSVALQNIFRLEEIRAFARTLEREVNDATKELRESNNKLLELDATKDEFVSMASHQLRTPLTSVKGYLSMVLEGDAGDLAPAQRELLKEAYTSSERMVHLIGDFLNMSRLQTGRFVIERHPVDIARIIEQEVDSMKPIALSHDIKLTLKKPTRSPILYLDENKIRQVVMNFIDNAIYYSPEGTPVDVVMEIEDGDVVLRVVDQGMGVPANVQKKLFTKFFRASNARKQRPDGTGIGLYLAKRIIDGHQGKLVFESAVGKGSTFGFRLPIRRLASPPESTGGASKKNTP